VIGRRGLASTLNQGAVGVEQQLRVVQRTTVSLVHPDGDHHAGGSRRCTDRVDSRRRYRHRLIQQLEVLRTHFERTLDEGEVRVVRDHRLRKGRELHILAGQLFDLFDYPLNCPLPAVENRTELHCGGTYYGHLPRPFTGAGLSLAEPFDDVGVGDLAALAHRL
jgi:hypothetical protein